MVGPNTLGDGQRSDVDIPDLAPDEPVKIAEVKRRFEVKCAARPNQETRALYWRRFLVFWECDHFDSVRGYNISDVSIVDIFLVLIFWFEGGS